MKTVPSTQKRTITLYIYLKEKGRGVMALYLKGLEKRHNHLNKSESTFPKNALCQIWSKLKQLFLEDKIFKYCQCFFLISLLSFLWKRAWFFIKKNQPGYLSPKGASSFVWKFGIFTWLYRQRWQRHATDKAHLKLSANVCASLPMIEKFSREI